MKEQFLKLHCRHRHLLFLLHRRRRRRRRDVIGFCRPNQISKFNLENIFRTEKNFQNAIFSGMTFTDKPKINEKEAGMSLSKYVYPQSSLVEGNEQTDWPNSQHEWNVDMHVQQFFIFFINTTAYHLGRYRLHLLLKRPMVKHILNGPPSASFLFIFCLFQASKTIFASKAQNPGPPLHE